ncbi:MAG: IS256 family transposase [Elusimicrobiota bacterium]
MTQRDFNKNLVKSEVEGLFSDNPDGLRKLIENVCQQILQKEISEHLQANWHERTPGRKGQRNGYKRRSIKTRVGKINLQYPQTRDSSFSTKLFDRYQRSEKALCLALMESYIQGVSTRRTKKITQELCGTEFSATTISNLSKELDSELEKFRNRDLSGKEYRYLIVDARYEKVRINKTVVDQAVLVIAGVSEYGHREILAVDVCALETEATWGEIFKNLKRRGLTGVEYIVSDAHEGIKNAIKTHFTGCNWQRCRVHFMRNIRKLVKAKDREGLKKALDFIWNSKSLDKAKKKAEMVVEFYEDKLPKVADKIENEIEETLTVLTLPSNHRKRMKSSNLLERLSGSISQRTNVVRIFPNRSSCLRLITAVLKEIHEDWISGRRYLRMLGEKQKKQTDEKGIEFTESVEKLVTA